MNTAKIILKKMAIVAMPTLLALTLTIAAAGNLQKCFEVYGKIYCEPPMT